MKAFKIIPAILTCAGLSACSNEATTAATAAAATEAGAKVRTATGSVQAASVDELNLTGALAINLPTVLAKKAGSLRLTGEKSIEACLMKANIGQLVTQVKMVSSTLCHIQAEGKNVPWNKPALLDFSEMAARLVDGPPAPPSGDTPTPDAPTADAPKGSGPSGSAPEAPELLGIYADDTNPDSIAVYLCEGATTAAMKLTQAFKINGSKSITKDGASVKVSKGTINLSVGDDTMGTFKGAIGFDSNFTQADTSGLKMQIKFSATGFTFSQSTEIETKDSGISKVTMSQVGSFKGGGFETQFKNASIGMFDAQNGHVFYTYSDGGAEDFSTQACVNIDSYLVECSGAKFVKGGALYAATADVPGVLPATFSPEAPSGFDCAKADWSTKIKPATDAATIAKHTACDAGMEEEASSGGPMGDCFSDNSYHQSGTEAEITFSEEAPGELSPGVSDATLPKE